MDIITLAGPYPEEVPGLLAKAVPAGLRIRAVKTQPELDALGDLQYVILRTLKLTGPVIGANPALKLIQRWGAGFDTVDIAAATSMDVPVTVAASVNSNAVAEHALLLMLATYRHLVPLDASVRHGAWDRTTHAPNSFMISDKLVGLVGCGAIGRLVAHKLRALGAVVQYYDATRLPAETERQLGLSYVDLHSLLATSDIISLHLPLTDQTRNIIGERELALMKPSAVLINTARGGLVDEDQLAAALRDGRIMGAALDSVAMEPYPLDGPLLAVDNLLMTPHIGGSVADLTLPMVRKVADNISRVFHGQPLPRTDLVNAPLCTYPVE